MKGLINEITIPNLISLSLNKKSWTNKLWENYILSEDNSIYNKMIINPQTKNKIRIKSALSYPKNSDVFKLASQMVKSFNNKGKLQKKVDATGKLADILKNHDFYYRYIDPGRKDPRHDEWKKHFDNENLMHNLMLFLGKTKAESIWKRYAPSSQKFPSHIFSFDNKTDKQNKVDKIEKKPDLPKPISTRKKQIEINKFVEKQFDPNVELEGTRAIRDMINDNLINNGDSNKSFIFIKKNMDKGYNSISLEDNIIPKHKQNQLMKDFIKHFIDFYNKNGKTKEIVKQYANAKSYRKFVKKYYKIEEK